MPYQTGLLDSLKFFGVPVIEVDGWRTRGNQSFNPKGATNHHTAGSRNGVSPSLGICINGRGGANPVAGPLCNVFGGRDLVARLVAAGRANHAGTGGFRGLTGNSSVFGLEMEHTGTSAEPVTEDTLNFMARVQAAFCRTGGFDHTWVHQHWEWTTRKIDFRKGVVDPNEFRDRVRVLLTEGNPATIGGFPTRVMRVGTSGPDVIAVKYGLNLMRDLTGRGVLPVHDRYDQLTASVVGSFQQFGRGMQQFAGHPQKDWLAVDEVWGPNTARTAAFWGALKAK